MKVYRTCSGTVAQHAGQWRLLPGDDWDAWFPQDELRETTLELFESGSATGEPSPGELLPPIVGQELWAAGVTYFRSRSARMDEAKNAGGGDFYDHVYNAERPELFFKAAGWRVRGPGQPVRIRPDSTWNVPEPELTLALSASGRINGYTIGNDMSSRSIEGENPLYLPQAKTYDGSAAIGPCVLLPAEPLPPETTIRLAIERGGETAFAGETALSAIKCPLEELADYLYRELSFPHGAFLMTGTGIVPDDDFTLKPGDAVHIDIEHIGRLTNRVE